MTKCWNCGHEATGQQCSKCGNSLSVAVQPSRVIDHPVPTTSVRSVPTSITGIGMGNVTSRAAQIQHASDESMVWEDSPSLVLLAGPIAGYILLAALALAVASNFPLEQAWPWAAASLAIFFLRLLYLFCELRCTRYRMSSQRLIVDAGVFTRISVPYELHLLSAAVIHSPIGLRLFGRGNLTIVEPRIRLRAIRKPEAVRDLLRNAGQWEASRMDKIRWR